MVGMPFVGLLFAISETALIFWTNQVLETAVANAARQIYTGQFQSDPANKTLSNSDLKTKFKKLVCDNVKAMLDCSASVSVDVRPASSYSGATVAAPITNGKYDTTGYGYQAPAADQITVVRATMEYPAFTGFLSPSSGLSNGNHLIIASAVFRTEPFK